MYALKVLKDFRSVKATSYKRVKSLFLSLSSQVRNVIKVIFMSCVFMHNASKDCTLAHITHHTEKIFGQCNKSTVSAAALKVSCVIRNNDLYIFGHLNTPTLTLFANTFVASTAVTIIKALITCSSCSITDWFLSSAITISTAALKVSIKRLLLQTTSLKNFFGDLRHLSRAYFSCYWAQILICWWLWPFMLLGQIYGISNFGHKFCR